MFTGAVVDITNLLSEVRFYTSKSLAESTKASYRTHLRSYLRFCLHYGFDPIPATQTSLSCYVAFLARSLKPTSINSYLNVIRILHQDAGMPNPLEGNFQIINLKRGISRELGTPPKQMSPITCEVLLAVRRCIRLDNGKDISFWAACCVAFFGFLRKSTLLPANLKNPGDDCLLRRDLHMTSASQFVLRIRKTKTIQFGQKVLIVPYNATPQRCILCPVTALKSLLLSTPYMPHLPLFMYYQGSTLSWWTHDSFVVRLRELLRRAGLKPAEYSCHSFRRGGASFAFDLNMSLIDIKQRGDWSSNAVEGYIHINKMYLDVVAQKLSQGAYIKCLRY